ncbi:MAG: FAD-dependent oxidoreductase [Pseudonocardiaceae bacterium]
MGRALVIGGGIAGTVTAIALKKVGWEPVVYEAYERTADGVGGWLGVGVNGVAALESIGLRDLIKDVGVNMSLAGISLGASGKKIVEFGRFGPQVGRPVNLSVLRSDLYVALRDEAVRRGITVEYGKRLTDAERTAAGVRATFTNGHAEGDVLVGADGVHSRVRQIVDPAAPAPRYIPFLQIDGRASGISVDAESQVYSMVFGRRCFFTYQTRPDGQIWWSAHPRRQSELHPAHLAAITGEQWRAELLGLFRGDRSPAVRLIEATPRIERPHVLYDLPIMPAWHRDRMILVGDAAHAASPASGQGASMAIEDAVTLAKCLRDSSGVERAFGEYERLRRERAGAVVAHGKRNGDQFVPGRLRQVLPFVAARAPRRVAAEDRSWISNYRIDWEEGTVVPSP